MYLIIITRKDGSIETSKYFEFRKAIEAYLKLEPNFEYSRDGAIELFDAEVLINCA